MLKKNKEKIAIILVIIIGILDLIICLYPWDTDLFFLIASGREIIKTGNLTINPFYNQGTINIIYQQWLWDVILAFFYDTIGNIGLYLLNAIQIFICFTLGLKFLNKYNSNRITNFFYVVIIISISCITSLRPEMVTMILLLLNIINIENWLESKNKKYLIIIPILYILEANLHGSMVIAHIIVTLPYICPIDIMNKKFTGLLNKLPLILTALFSILCSLINPYSYNLYKVLLSSFNDYFKALHISECEPTVMISIHGIIAIIVICTLVYLVTKKAISSIDLYMISGLTLLLMLKYRFYYLYIIAALFLIKTLFVSHMLKKQDLKFICIMLFTLMYVNTGLIMHSIDESNINTDNALTPLLAVEWLNENATKDVKVYTSFANGAYLEFMGYKSYGVACTERQFKLVNGVEDYIIDEIQLAHNYNTKSVDDYSLSGVYEEFMHEHDFDYLIVCQIPFAQYLKSAGYEIILEGNNYIMFSNKN